MQNDNVESINNPEENLSEEQQIVLDSVSIPQQVHIQIENAPSISKDALQMNESFELARIMYQDVLSPQLRENEALKRKQKDTLMEEIFKILNLQFIFTYIYVLVLIVGTLSSSFFKISESIIQNTFKFVEFYVTSIVVELLSILFFIVKNVFDTSIVDLMKDFDKRKRKKDKKRKSDQKH